MKACSTLALTLMFALALTLMFALARTLMFTLKHTLMFALRLKNPLPILFLLWRIFPTGRQQWPHSPKERWRQCKPTSSETDSKSCSREEIRVHENQMSISIRTDSRRNPALRINIYRETTKQGIR